MIEDLVENIEKFKYLYLFNAIEKNGKELHLADKISYWYKSSEAVAGFDRSLWSVLSAGMMPAELFTMRIGNTGQNSPVVTDCLLLMSPNELDDFPQNLKLLEKFEVSQILEENGEITSPEENDECFEEGFFATVLIWQNRAPKFSCPSGGKMFKMTERMSVILSKSLSYIDVWIEDYLVQNVQDLLYSAYVFIPGKIFLENLCDVVMDKEKIHLSEEIKGIHC